MEQSKIASLGTQGEFNGQVFLLEIVTYGQKSSFAQRSAYPRSRIVLQVPKQRMSQELQRITQRGGKILSIKTLGSQNEYPREQPNLLPWWVEISTANPKCLYYFGPFDSMSEARSHQDGYVEDLESEGAREIVVVIKQCQPSVLTQEG